VAEPHLHSPIPTQRHLTRRPCTTTFQQEKTFFVAATAISDLAAWHKFMNGKTFPHAAVLCCAAPDSAFWHAGKSAAAAGNIQSMRHVGAESDSETIVKAKSTG